MMTDSHQTPGEMLDESHNPRSELEPDGSQLQIDDVSDLYNLQPGAQIEVTRISPAAIKGYVGHLVVPEDGMGDVKEELKSSWGGGTYQLKGKQLSKGGKLQYARGYCRLDVAGYPISEGKEYINGVWREIRPPAANPMPTQIAMPSAPSNSGSTANDTLAVLNAVLPLLSHGDLGGTDLPGLITAISGISGKGGERDAFRDVERTLVLLRKLQDSPLGGTQIQPEQPTSMGFEQMMPMLMMKMMMGQGPTNTPNMPWQNGPQSPWNAPNSYQNAQPWGAQMPQNQWGAPPTPGYPYGAAPPQQNPAGWTSPPPPGTEYGQAPRQNPPASAQPAEKPPATPEVKATLPNGQGHVVESDEESEWIPVSPDDVLHELSTRDDAGKIQFLDELCSKLGIDRAMLAQMQQGMAGGGGAVNGAGPQASESSTGIPGFTLQLEK